MKSNYGKQLNYVKTQFICHSENVGLSRMLTGCFVGNSNEKNLDLTVSQLEEIKVAVSEAVSNAIIHGYNSDNKGIVTFILESYEKALIIKISDKGTGIENIEQAVQPSFSTKAERMGLGFAFMNSFMDEVIVDSEIGKGTTVTLIKKLPIKEEMF
ncbi:MAG: anti-sigma F factor [Bacillota bacterium]|jgi:stage II sporulation protein AB (anti-sigma F factor)